MTETIYGVQIDNSQALRLIKKEDITNSKIRHGEAMVRILEQLQEPHELFDPIGANNHRTT